MSGVGHLGVMTGAELRIPSVELLVAEMKKVTLREVETRVDAHVQLAVSEYHHLLIYRRLSGTK